MEEGRGRRKEGRRGKKRTKKKERRKEDERTDGRRGEWTYPKRQNHTWVGCTPKL
jgi:hypothetical protein